MDIKLVLFSVIVGIFIITGIMIAAELLSDYYSRE